MTLNLDNHPCFSDTARHTYGRVHLPVAPKCNVQCNYCNRKYDCANESRPGVTSAVLSPHQAMAYLKYVFEEMPNISVVGIAGPGDPFANAERTMETMRLVREEYPDMILCLATNGLNLRPYVDEVAELNVSHVTVTVNTVDPKIGSKIYAWARYKKKMYRPEDGAKILLEQQLESIKALKEKGVTVKVNTIIMPGINEDHIEEVAAKMSELGVDVLNCMSYYPTIGSAFEDMTPPSPQMINEVKGKAGQYVSLMHHCSRCRADAVGLLGEGTSIPMMEKMREARSLPRNAPVSYKPDITNRPYIAATSMEGMLVNQHLGEADFIYIFGQKDGQVEFIETRRTPPSGGGMDRWSELADILYDCNTILVNGIGPSPTKVFQEKGLAVLEVEGMIEEAARALYEGTSLNHLIKRSQTICGEACSGTATGCG